MMRDLRAVVTLSLLFASALHADEPGSPVNSPPPGRFSQATQTVAAAPNLTSLGAQRVIDAAVAEAVRNRWTISIAVIDAGGNLLAFRRLDGATIGTIEVAQRKAKTALTFGMSSADVGKIVTRSGPAMLTLSTDMTAFPGGELIRRDGVIVGAIGVSGGFKGEDDVVIAAALAALTTPSTPQGK